MILHYARNSSPAFKTVVREAFDEHDNLNYLLERKDRSYNEAGRTQTEEGAVKVDNGIQEVIEKEEISYKVVYAERKKEGIKSDDKAVEIIVGDVLKHFKQIGILSK